MDGLGRGILDVVLKIATLPQTAAGTAQNGFQAVAPSWTPFWVQKKCTNNIIILIYCSTEQALRRAGMDRLGRGMLNVVLNIATITWI